MYTKQNFINGQVLTAEHLNNIENGIITEVQAIYNEMANLNNDVTIAVFAINSLTNATVALTNIDGIVKVDWGDGTENSSYTHTYQSIGLFTCKIYGATAFKTRAFASAKQIKTIVFADSVTTIGESAFRDCLNLALVRLPDLLQSLGEESFASCSSLATVDLGKGLSNIPRAAFMDCSKLKFLKIPQNITSIQSDVFKGCEGLEELMFESYNPITYSNWFGFSSHGNCRLVVPAVSIHLYCSAWPALESRIVSTVYSADASAFRKEMTEIPSITAIFECNSPTTVSLNLPTEGPATRINWGDGVANIENSHTYAAGRYECTMCAPSMAENMFKDCSALISVSISGYIKEIPKSAFENCSSLFQVNLNYGLKKIEESAFSNCSSLNNITIPESVDEIGLRAFASCSSGLVVKFMKSRAIAFNDWGHIDRFIVPAEYISVYKHDWSAVERSIYSIAYTSEGDLKEILAPRSLIVLNIPTAPLAVNFTLTDTVLRIDWGDGTIDCNFSHIYSQKGTYTCKVYATSLGECFANNPRIVNVKISDEITEINEGAFWNCSNLKKVDIGNGVQTIGYKAFFECYDLSEIILGNSLLTIKGLAFMYNCGDGILEIPESVTEIETKAFSSAASEWSKIIFNNPTPIPYTEAMLETVVNNIYVPYGTKAAYINKWTADGAPQEILDLIVESNRQATINDIRREATLKSDMNYQYFQFLY